MKSSSHATLHAAYAEQSSKAGKPVRSNWIAAVLEALYQLQRRQALKVIRAYQRLLVPQKDGAGSVKAAAEPRRDAGL